MWKFVILAVCGLSCLTQATPAKLSKELATAPEIERQHAFEQLQNFDYLEAFVKLVLKSPERAVANVNELLTKNNSARAEEVLDAFNAGLNARLFIINGDYVELDRTAFGRMLVENTLGFLPGIQQRSANSMFDRKLQEYVSAIEFKQPLEQFNAVLAADRQQIRVRAFSFSFIIDSIRLSITSAISSILSSIASLIVNILATIVIIINNSLVWLQTRISFLYTLLNPIATLINNILQQIIDWISPLIKSATSREVTVVTNPTTINPTSTNPTTTTTTPTKNGNIITTLLNYVAQALASVIRVVGGNVVGVLTTVANFLAKIIASVEGTLNNLFS